MGGQSYVIFQTISSLKSRNITPILGLILKISVQFESIVSWNIIQSIFKVNLGKNGRYVQFLLDQVIFMTKEGLDNSDY